MCTRSAEKLLTSAVLCEASVGREGSGWGVRWPGGGGACPVVRSTHSPGSESRLHRSVASGHRASCLTSLRPQLPHL